MPSIQPFRFVHTGDLHLDSPFVGVTAETPTWIASTLRDATFQAWQRIVQLAVDEAVDFVVVAGDVFEHANRTLRGQVAFVDGLRRLADAGISSYVVTGITTRSAVGSRRSSGPTARSASPGIASRRVRSSATERRSLASTASATA